MGIFSEGKYGAKIFFQILYQIWECKIPLLSFPGMFFINLLPNTPINKNIDSIIGTKVMIQTQFT